MDILEYVKLGLQLAGQLSSLVNDLIEAHTTNDQAKLDATRAKLDAAADALAAPPNVAP